jgi:hypothetical protein
VQHHLDLYKCMSRSQNVYGGRRGRVRMVVGFTIPYAISV